jgi:hypothetical protein
MSPVQPFCPHLLGKALHNGVIEAQVEHSVHHAGHGQLGVGERRDVKKQACRSGAQYCAKESAGPQRDVAVGGPDSGDSPRRPSGH